MRLFLNVTLFISIFFFSPALGAPAYYLAPTVVYRLVAKSDGRFACFPCKAFGEAEIYLAKSEVWKYGITNNPEGRYSAGDYEQQYFEMEIIMRYDARKPALWTEHLLIWLYPYGLRNLRRKEPLPMPPGHKIRR